MVLTLTGPHGTFGDVRVAIGAYQVFSTAYKSVWGG
jgi:hypothetical protein